MTAQELIIYKSLQMTPDHAYIMPDGKALYALTDGGMMCLTSELDLKTLSDEEINKFILETLS